MDETLTPHPYGICARRTSTLWDQHVLVLGSHGPAPLQTLSGAAPAFREVFSWLPPAPGGGWWGGFPPRATAPPSAALPLPGSPPAPGLH